ncbi:hypothetical protein V6N11_070074 [Hibiscus sabdariffa]|uniref:Uncharacterized protein n=1 Tax=Hibiscus sabdariffa TaxID=183260 RepID=A0ABR2QED0_9ROSI
MSSFNCFILALFAALMFSNIDVDLAARRLQQLSHLPKIGLPPLPQPIIPTMLKSGSLPPLLSIPNLSSAPKVTLPIFPLIPRFQPPFPLFLSSFHHHQLPVIETIWLLRHGFHSCISLHFLLFYVDGGGERKGIEGMVVEIVGIKGKLGSGGRVTFGALSKLRMLGSGGSEPGFNTVGIVG